MRKNWNRLKHRKSLASYQTVTKTQYQLILSQQFGDSKDYAWFENTFLKNLPLSKVSKGLKNALIAAFGVQNPDAEAVEINGEVQMDSELTDYEHPTQSEY